MQNFLQGIADKAKRLKDYRFRDLSRMLTEDFLKHAWKHINKKASPGVDKVTAQEYEANLDHNIKEVVSKLRTMGYKAKLIRRVEIPKGNGKTRPLGIPAINDKVVQQAVTMILEAIFEQDFHSCSYGYRPGRGPKDAVKDLSKELQMGKYNYIVEADIKSFFDNINHEILITMLEKRIDDKRFIRLIKKWLKAGILKPNGTVEYPDTGTPQGGIVSPILANIYLHNILDVEFHQFDKEKYKGQAFYIRFADDFIAAFQNKYDALFYRMSIRTRLRTRGLHLAEEKTRLIHFTRFEKSSAFFVFLGFEFRWGTSRKGKSIIKRKTSKSKLKKSIQSFKVWCKANVHLTYREFFKQVNAKLRGYYNYYGVIGNYASLNKYFYHVKGIMFKRLNRRSQRRSCTWEKFYRLIKRYNLLTPRITEKVSDQLLLFNI